MKNEPTPEIAMHNLHHTDDDSPEAFIERVRGYYNMEKTGLDELLEIARDDPGSERFETLLDDLTYEALAENEDFNENRKKMTSGKLSSEEQTEVREKQRGLFNTYRQAIIYEAGLPTEAALTEADKSKHRIKTLVESTLDINDQSEPLRVLETLGIIAHDQEGREIFLYPRGLFPKSTDSKWETYLESVKDHLRIERAVHHGTLDKAELGEADATRRLAHNAVTKDVHGMLGLEKLESPKWDFEKTRNLLAKMRDSRFPTVETAEKFTTENAVIEATIGLHALRALRGRLSDMHK